MAAYKADVSMDRCLAHDFKVPRTNSNIVDLLDRFRESSLWLLRQSTYIVTQNGVCRAGTATLSRGLASELGAIPSSPPRQLAVHPSNASPSRCC